MIDTDRKTIHAKGPLIPILQISPTKYLQFSWPSKITDYVPSSNSLNSLRLFRYVLDIRDGIAKLIVCHLVRYHQLENRADMYRNE
jgi:hypothetical protein